MLLIKSILLLALCLLIVFMAGFFIYNELIPVDHLVLTPEAHRESKTDSHRFIVQARELNVRTSPSLSSPVTEQLKYGQLVGFNIPVEEVIADGYSWVKHEYGWSVKVFLKNTLEFDRLFSKHPVSITSVRRLQPFGDTEWARKYHKKTYRYSSGMHGGLDFLIYADGVNNNYDTVDVIAGVHGRVKKKTKTGIRISFGDYLIIYEHLAEIPSSLKEGDNINPDTVLGKIDVPETYPTNAHLHLEVRYNDIFIINPLPLLPETDWSTIEIVKYHGDAEFKDPYYQIPIVIGD